MKKGSHSKPTKRQNALGVMTRVLRLRIKDKHAKHLLEQSREVNQVWNYSQDLALKVLAREHRFMSAYDMAAYTKGAAKEGLSLHSQTVHVVHAILAEKDSFAAQLLRQHGFGQNQPPKKNER